MIYLDNAATTRIDDEVFASMEQWLKESYGNPGAKYGIGREAAIAISEARDKVAKYMGCTSDHIIFTSGGSEANSLAIHSACPSRALMFSGEHHSTTSAMYHTNSSAIVDIVSRGFDTTDDEFVGAISRRIGDWYDLVSVMYVNNETGVVNPVEAIGGLCKKNNIIFHTDCVQAAGCVPIDVERIGCDFASISGHKIHAPKGVGALYVRDLKNVKPIIYGGDAQERGLRGGTESVASIVALGTACDISSKNWLTEALRASELKLLFYSTLMDKMRSNGTENTVHVNGLKPEEHGKILNLRFDHTESETLLMLLDSKGVCVSAGSACNSHSSEPSQVLMSYGLTPEQASSSIRFSFSKYNTEEEVCTAANIVADCVGFLQNIS